MWYFDLTPTRVALWRRNPWKQIYIAANRIAPLLRYYIMFSSKSIVYMSENFACLYQFSQFGTNLFRGSCKLYIRNIVKICLKICDYPVLVSINLMRFIINRTQYIISCALRFIRHHSAACLNGVLCSHKITCFIIR